MESGNCLGIYITKESATAVCLAPHGRDMVLQGCFSVSVDKDETAPNQVLASLIAQGCTERGFKFSEVAVALNCVIFMQHNVHSEFDNPKQIAATVRFDTEEALATDVSDVAIAFKITSSDKTGSQLAVFTTQKKILSEIISALQNNNIDPITIEPDVNCLSRFIRQKVTVTQDKNPFFAMFSRRNGYFIFENQSPEAASSQQSLMRTFLAASGQDKTQLLTREIPVTTALLQTSEPINCLEVFDSTGSVNTAQLSEALTMEVSQLDMAASAQITAEQITDCADPLDFAIAFGAALTISEKTRIINFRDDFMPFQGKKARLQKTIKLLSVCVAVLMLALGVHFQTQLVAKSKPVKELRTKFSKDYSAVMLGKKLPAKSRKTIRSLQSELNRIKALKEGRLSSSGEKSISAKLTMVLDAFNSCAAKTKLDIDSISITGKSISIIGSTSSRSNTRKLRDAIEKSGMEILKDSVQQAPDGREKFTITMIPRV